MRKQTENNLSLHDFCKHILLLQVVAWMGVIPLILVFLYNSLKFNNLINNQT